MAILLTGATGFVGREILNVFRDDIISVVRAGSSHNLRATFEIDGIHSNTDWQGAFDNIDTIIHLAGPAHKKANKNEYIETITKGTLHLANQAADAGVKKLIFLSSIGVNGDVTQGEPFDGTQKASPHNDYTEAKYLAEKGLWNISKNTHLNVVVVRAPLVYGANAPGNFSRLVKIITKFRLLPFGLCFNLRSFISVTNLAHFLYLCDEHPNAVGQTFVISDGESVSVKEFTSAIAKGLGKPILHLPIPRQIMSLVAIIIGKRNIAKQLFGELLVDSSNARSLLNWKPPETIKEAMAKLNK